jgi:hypothetical protein
LMLFADLPARESWEKILPPSQRLADLAALAEAAVALLDQRGPGATTCRWLRVFVVMAQGKLIFPPHLADTAKAMWAYPANPTDEAAAAVRSAEMMLDLTPVAQGSAWPEAFWRLCLTETPCVAAPASGAGMLLPATTVASVGRVRTLLIQHASDTRTTSAVGARHEAVFGFGLYSLSVLEELLRIGNATSVLGRLGLRTLAECRITLAYLLSKDDSSLWASYRSHGAGQAKLNLLKLDERAPSSVDPEVLDRLANEDIWQEFVPIELGHWAKTDLRKMSEAAGVKTAYDRHYGWPSNYTHGQWSAIRDAEYQVCSNPLHRLHRVPLEQTRPLPDVVADAAELTDEILGAVDQAYPGFAARVRIA